MHDHVEVAVKLAKRVDGRAEGQNFGVRKEAFQAGLDLFAGQEPHPGAVVGHLEQPVHPHHLIFDLTQKRKQRGLENILGRNRLQ